MTLDDICAALRVDSTAAQRAALLAYLDLLQRWNATFNLTAVREPAAMLTHHLADCLAVLGPLSREASGPIRLLDVGSGGGLPGVVVAILRPDVQVTCIDTVGKKAAFVRQVAAALALPNLHAQHGRVEELHEERFDVIAARAFASLRDLVQLSRASLKAGGLWLAMKGRLPGDEIKQLPSDIEVFHVEQLAVPGLDAERHLVWMCIKDSRPRVLPS